MSLSLWNWMHAMQEIVLYVHWPKDKHAEGCSQIKFLRSVLMAFNFFLTEIQHVIKSDNSKGRWISLNHGGGLRAFYPPPVILLRITVLICIFQLACKITGFSLHFCTYLVLLDPHCHTTLPCSSSYPLADLRLASVFPFCFSSHVCYLIHVFLVNNCQRHLRYHSQITFLTFMCFFYFKHNSLLILWKFHIMYPNLTHLPAPPFPPLAPTICPKIN